MSATLYSLRQVCASYAARGSGGRNALCALNIDALDISQESILGLCGHNGSGKTTLLRLLGFQLSPTSGTILFQGQKILCPDHHLRRQAVLLGQDTCLLKRSVAANVGYGLGLRGQAAPEAAIAQALDEVGLNFSDYARRSWRQLSGGEARRVALAARLILRPEVLLLDEPTAGLDRSSAQHVKRAALAARQERGATLVIASHDMDWLKSCADEVLVLEEGRVRGRLNAFST